MKNIYKKYITNSITLYNNIITNFTSTCKIFALHVEWKNYTPQFSINYPETPYIYIYILECKLERGRLVISFQVASLLERREKFRWNRKAFIPPIHDSYHDRIDESFQLGLAI